MYKYDLSGNWKLRYEELFWNKDYFSKVLEKKDGWLDITSFPCDVHEPLINEGIIADPLVAENCYNCEWIEDKSWWFMNTFTVTDRILNSQVSELVLEGMDVEADIYLNSNYLGHHKSQTYPFRKNVKDIIKGKENILLVRVTSGLEYFSELEMSGLHWKKGVFTSNRFIRNCGDRRDDRRIFLRKPQYVYGWDWNPRIATCGITGGARIEAINEIAIRNAKLTTKKLSSKCAKIDIEVELENMYPVSTVDADVSIEMYFGNKKVYAEKKDTFLKSGYNYISTCFSIDNPKLWWPNGMGDQNIYEIRITAVTTKNSEDRYAFRAGLRTVELDTERLSEGRRFAFIINGVRTFCKGGNWVTADSIYARVTDEKYDTLIKEAKEANYNMLRFNGVGAYERDFFYESCDKYGIMVWQDFLFSCGSYPDHYDWFRQEVKNEVEYQIKRLRNHPCIVLWSGNNECQISVEGYGRFSYTKDENAVPFPMGVNLYNEVMPKLVKEHCSDIPYWNSSPFGGPDINGPHYGDIHPWGKLFMNEVMENRITLKQYDTLRSRFVSEFGCVGPTKKSSLVKYYGSEEIVVGSDNWNLHTNEFEKGTIKEAIKMHYKDAENLTLDDYLLYSGLFQGVMLGYAYESLRCLDENFGALIWSYNDCRGEIGWSIIDYYLERKIAYYFVKRALANTKLVIREYEGAIKVICINDTSNKKEIEIEYGYTSFSGEKKGVKKEKINIQPFGKTIITTKIDKADNDFINGIYYAKANDSKEFLPVILKLRTIREQKLLKPDIKISNYRKNNNEIIFEISANQYIHAVYFSLGEGVLLSDEYFDLLPGEIRELSIRGEIEKLGEHDISPDCIYI